MKTMKVNGYVRTLPQPRGGDGEGDEVDSYERPYERYGDLVVLDTETSTDLAQNLKIGSFIVVKSRQKLFEGLFYEPENNTAEENQIIQEYCQQKKLKLYTRKDFVEKVFYPRVFYLRHVCVGANLPYDLSRLAIDFSEGRGKGRSSFSLKLSENSSFPRIRINHVDNKRTFISFSSIRSRRHRGYRGRFLDLLPLNSILSQDRHISLKKACEYHKIKDGKIEVEQHGRINPAYIDYNRRDTESTLELCWRTLDEYERYGIDLDILQVFSEASLAKKVLSQMGILPFQLQNPTFDKKLIGQVFNGMYGGRVELNMRKTPVKVTVLDATSMYPTVFTLMGLYELLIADKIECEVCTEKVQHLLDNLKLEDTFNPDFWKNQVGVGTFIPDDDILPFRAKYETENGVGAKITPSIGVNYVKHDEPMTYTLGDIVASTLQTGKAPKLLEAIVFKANGVQKTLKETEILGIKVDPLKDNIVKKFVEKRDEYKKLVKDKNDEYDIKQRALKVMMNILAYGVSVQLTPTGNERDVEVYGNSSYLTTMSNYEKPGQYFNPLIGVTLLGASRLLIAMAETMLKRDGKTLYYCDTDSLFVPPESAKKLQEAFQGLNPYSIPLQVLKIEKEQVMFYGISSKRYCLFHKDGDNITIGDDEFSQHGLGHLTSPFPKEVKDWQSMVWRDTLEVHYGISTIDDLALKYGLFYAITKQTVSTPSVYKRFDNYNKGKPLNQQVRPFNFYIQGLGNVKINNFKVVPIVPYTRHPQEAPYHSFIDKTTGRRLNGTKYWQTLDSVILRYLDHPESKKANGDETGLMHRKHITNIRFRYIGKEVHNYGENTRTAIAPTELVDWDEVKRKILKLQPKDLKHIEVKPQTLWKIKKRLREGRQLNPKTKIVSKIIKHLEATE